MPPPAGSKVVSDARREKSHTVDIITPEEALARRGYWAKCCTGDLSCLENILFFPCVTVYQAVRIYVCPCAWLYFSSTLDSVLCGLFRLICCACCFRHTDRRFPPNASSLGDWDGKSPAEVDKEIKWERATDIFKSRWSEKEKQEGRRVKLYEDGIEPKDVAQGDLGDCWLIAALACMAENPGFIRKIFVTPRYNSRGKYTVRLFDGQTGRWTHVSVDEYLPVKKKDGRLLFAQPKGNELWVVIIEKAFAKFCGDYNQLKGGQMVWAFQALTGDPVFSLHVRQDGKWECAHREGGEPLNTLRQAAPREGLRYCLRLGRAAEGGLGGIRLRDGDTRGCTDGCVRRPRVRQAHERAQQDQQGPQRQGQALDRPVRHAGGAQRAGHLLHPAQVREGEGPDGREHFERLRRV